MMDASTDDDCPVCKGPLQNPSQPVPCCRKVFCQSCLRHAILVRPLCPYCRSPVNDRATLAFGPSVRRTLNLQDALLQTTRPVGPNVQLLLSRLRAANVQASQTCITPNASLRNQVASNAAVQAPGHPAIRQPVPRPRVRNLIQVAPGPPAAPAIPAPVPANPNPLQIDLQPDEPLYMNVYPVDTHSCPYCQEGGLDDLALRDHCNDNHLSDQRHVVCPVCVSLPHGNPTYCSRDFIGHLNLRHSYYISDITNVLQNDDVNLQDAILRSYQQQ